MSQALSKLNTVPVFYTGPYLDGMGITNVTTQIGTHAYLPCKVSEELYLYFNLYTQLYSTRFGSTFILF